ncbi:MAG: purine-nucleoside phosphorylase [Treponemataceae bacterium]|nr:purine-nucleoside phosphorylase [Treponemataceae bacterium]
MSTPHNSAQPGDIAPSVLLPGDPLRAKYVAEKYLTGAKQITGVRNMLGFTGMYGNTPVTVMGSGMGGPSCGIYSYELFSFYNVEQIIRIGTAGGLAQNLKVGDLVFAMTASTDSNWAHQYNLNGSFSPCGDFELLNKAVEFARKKNFGYAVGSVFSSDLFSQYDASNQTTGEESWRPWARMGCLAQDMETFALYSTASWLKKRALSILTHTDSCINNEHLPAEKRLSALEPMFETALNCLL